MTATEYFKKAKADGYVWADKAIEYRKCCLYNKEDIELYYIHSLSTALSISFNWSQTKEGHEYWDKIYAEVREAENKNVVTG
jgi:hypothetical protein